MSRESAENQCFKAANEIFNISTRMEKMLQKLSSRLTSTTPPTSVEQLHCPLLICYPQHPESHQSHLQNRSQWQGQDRFFAPDPPPKFTSSVNISLCIVFRKDDFDSDTMAVAVCNFWMTKENNNLWICLFAINQASCHHLDREEHGKIPNSKFSISSKSTWVGQSHPAEQQRSTNEDGR